MAARASGSPASRVTATAPKCSSFWPRFNFVICSKSNRYHDGTNLAGFPANTPRPGHTAFTATTARAGHLCPGTEPLIFSDTLATRPLGDHAEELLTHHRLHGTHRPILPASAPKRYTGAGSANRA